MRDIPANIALKYASEIEDMIDQEWLSKELHEIESYTPPRIRQN